MNTNNKTEICATCGHEWKYHNKNGVHEVWETKPSLCNYYEDDYDGGCSCKKFVAQNQSPEKFNLTEEQVKKANEIGLHLHEDTQTLKTLKDIKADLYVSRKIKNAVLVVPIETLRQEAIKWVKQHRNIKPNWAKETNEEFFMAFFNITEEELK